jgi:DNA mismatch endonuclease (patch repair protein)
MGRVKNPWSEVMPDKLSGPQRSAHMARIRRAHTKPEREVRSLLHRLGYRFRVQLAGVPGRPDVAFTARKKAVFVHGCFWHAHEGCRLFHLPQTRREFWAAKFLRNKTRDQRLLEAARLEGWDCLVVWECETRRQDLAARLVAFLGPPDSHPASPSRSSDALGAPSSLQEAAG